MNKSVIILISAVWLICITYMTLGKIYEYPYRPYAMIGSWCASVLLLLCIIIYVRKHRAQRKK